MMRNILIFIINYILIFKLLIIFMNLKMQDIAGCLTICNGVVL